MRSGPAPADHDKPRVSASVAGVTREAVSVQVERTMGGSGVPGSRDMATASGRVVWSRLPDVLADLNAPSPWRRSGGWPPVPGEDVEIATGTRLAGVYSALAGVVDESSGSRDGTVETSIIDPIDRLRRSVTIPPLLASMPPSVEGGDLINVGMSSDYIADRALRMCGVFSTPWMPTGKNGVAVPGQGSVLPQRGTVTAAGQATDHDLAVDFYSSNWGWGIYDCDASFDADGTVSMSSGFEFAAMVAPWHEATASVTACLSGRSEYFRLVVNASRSLELRYFNGTSESTVCSLAAASSWQRVSARVSGSSVTLSTNDDRTTSGAHGAGSAVTTAAVSSVRIVVLRGGCIGGVIAANLDAGYYFNTTLGARLYSGTSLNPKLVASPSIINRDALDLVSEIADATCRAFWWTEDGLLSWMPGDYMFSRDPVAELTSLDNLLDLGWSQAMGDVFSSVIVNSEQPAVARSKTTSVTVWQGGSTTTQGTDSQFINAGDEDWFYVNAPTQLVPGNVAAFNNGIGSWYGATTDAGALVADAALSVTLAAVSVGTWKLNTYAAAKYDQKVPDLAAPLKKWLQGYDLPVLRARAKTTWADSVDMAGSGPDSSAQYAHDAGRWAQGYAGETGPALASFLATWLCAARVKATNVRVRHDPRIQIGDIVTVRDEHAFGVVLTALVTRIQQEVTPSSRSMTLDLFIVSAARDGVTYDELSDLYDTYADLTAPTQSYDRLGSNPI